MHAKATRNSSPNPPGFSPRLFVNASAIQRPRLPCRSTQHQRLVSLAASGAMREVGGRWAGDSDCRHRVMPFATDTSEWVVCRASFRRSPFYSKFSRKYALLGSTTTLLSSTVIGPLTVEAEKDRAPIARNHETPSRSRPSKKYRMGCRHAPVLETNLPYTPVPKILNQTH